LKHRAVPEVARDSTTVDQTAYLTHVPHLDYQVVQCLQGDQAMRLGDCTDFEEVWRYGLKFMMFEPRHFCDLSEDLYYHL